VKVVIADKKYDHEPLFMYIRGKNSAQLLMESLPRVLFLTSIALKISLIKIFLHFDFT